MSAVVIAATFTARPLEKPLLEAGAGAVAFAPYNRLMQWLLDPPPAVPGEIPVLLIRVEDFVRGDKATAAARLAAMAERADAHLQALGQFLARRPGIRPLLLLVPSADAAACAAAEAGFRALDSVGHLDWRRVVAAAGDARLFDPIADRLGHVPMTLAAFRAVAAEIHAACDALPPDPTARAGLAPAATPAGMPAPEPDGAAALDRFLRRLQLRVACRPIIEPAQFAVAAKLAHTVASFHASGRRLTEADLRAALAGGATVGWLIEVADRFGDYGPSGFLLIDAGETPVLREFVLNCVILGKQVEHALVAALAARAGAAAPLLAFDHADLPGNADATGFLRALHRIAGADHSPAPGAGSFVFAVDRLADAARALATSPQAVAEVAVDLAPGWPAARRPERSADVAVA